jgi:hypothetical protein
MDASYGPPPARVEECARADDNGPVSEPAPEPFPTRARRVNGLALMLALVAAGMGITSIYYHWKAPAIVAERRAALASMSTAPESMLDLWLEYGAPAIHARLQQMRIEAAHPWLVTHARESERAGEPPLLWGIDLAGLDPAWVRREGVTVVLTLPAPRELGRAWLPADKQGGVLRLAEGVLEPSSEASSARALEVARWSLARLDRAVRKDIPGATIEVRVAEETP